MNKPVNVAQNEDQIKRLNLDSQPARLLIFLLCFLLMIICVDSFINESGKMEDRIEISILGSDFQVPWFGPLTEENWKKQQ